MFNREYSANRGKEWEVLYQGALSAAQTNYLEIKSSIPVQEIPGSPFPWNSRYNQIRCDVGAASYLSGKKLYGLVDGKTSKNPLNLFPLTKKGSNRKIGTFYCSISEEARRHQLKGLESARIRVFAYEHKLEVALKWYQAVEGLEFSEPVAQLRSQQRSQLIPWQPEYLEYPLGKRQQEALAAMSTPGGYFIWGPPGTGKTTVIASAIKKAVDNGQTVLVTSHTNAAIDNALERLLELDKEQHFGLFDHGDIIRKTPKNITKVSEIIRNEPAICDKKAASLIIGYEEEYERLENFIVSNAQHPDRKKEESVKNEIYMLDRDQQGIRLFLDVLDDYTQYEQCKAASQEYHSQKEGLVKQAYKVSQEIRKYNESIVSLEMRSVNDWNTYYEKERNDENCQAIHNMVVKRRNRLKKIESIVQWLEESFYTGKTIASKYQNYVSRADEEVAASRVRLTTARAELETSKSLMKELELQYDTAVSKLNELLWQQQRIAQEIQSVTGEIDKCRDDEYKYETNIREKGYTLDIVKHQYAEFQDTGQIELGRSWIETIDSVSRLDKEQSALKAEQTNLNDKLRKQQQALLKNAQVMACTIESLMYDEILQNRTFDIVIIDEVSSAEASKVIYTAAKARTTCVLVGDFLQNAPVVEDVTEKSLAPNKNVKSWQHDDIFKLVGIVDKTSAMHNPRCVCLDEQHRFPRIVADLVNDFCYDGLIQSPGKPVQEDHTVIDFIDTSNMNIHFEQIRGSWTCIETAKLAASLISDNVGDESVGYVTPYREQVRLAEGYLPKTVGCGTSHRFQGREFDTVIVDLMQDGEKARWIASAAVGSGSDIALGAARVLNVAVTRAKKHLYIIGDWCFISSASSPGMKAIAKLAQHGDFCLRKLPR